MRKAKLYIWDAEGGFDYVGKFLKKTYACDVIFLEFGIEQSSRGENTVAIIELPDGHVDTVEPCLIQFIDEPIRLINHDNIGELLNEITELGYRVIIDMRYDAVSWRIQTPLLKQDGVRISPAFTEAITLKCCIETHLKKIKDHLN